MSRRVCTAAVVDRAGVARQVAAPADARHVAPAFGGEVVGAGLARVQLQHLGVAPFDQQIRQSRALVVEKAAPMFTRADHLVRRNAGEAFAGAIPYHHARAGVEHEHWNGQHIHQLEREYAIGWGACYVGQALKRRCTCHVRSFGLSIEEWLLTRTDCASATMTLY